MNSDFHVAIVGKPRERAFTTWHVAQKILGAGIGGLALAMGLHKRDVPFTLYKEAKEYSAVGYVLNSIR